MSEKIYDSILGEVETENNSKEWLSKWNLRTNQPVDVEIRFDEGRETLPGSIKQLLELLKNDDEKIRQKIADEMINLCNEDWNPDNTISEDVFAKSIKLTGITISARNNLCELFYDDANIFAGHTISVFTDFAGNISEPSLAG